MKTRKLCIACDKMIVTEIPKRISIEKTIKVKCLACKQIAAFTFIKCLVCHKIFYRNISRKITCSLKCKKRNNRMKNKLCVRAYQERQRNKNV